MTVGGNESVFMGTRVRWWCTEGGRTGGSQDGGGTQKKTLIAICEEPVRPGFSFTITCVSASHDYNESLEKALLP